MSYTNLREVPDAVRHLREFKGNNVYGSWVGATYGVFSYGQHFPIAIYARGVWFVNTDKYSSSTSRHQSAVRSGLDGRTVNVGTKILTWMWSAYGDLSTLKLPDDLRDLVNLTPVLEVVA